MPFLRIYGRCFLNSPNHNVNDHGMNFLNTIGKPVMRNNKREIADLLELAAVLSEQTNTFHPFFGSGLTGFNYVGGISGGRYS